MLDENRSHKRLIELFGLDEDFTPKKKSEPNVTGKKRKRCDMEESSSQKKKLKLEKSHRSSVEEVDIKREKVDTYQARGEKRERLEEKLIRLFGSPNIVRKRTDNVYCDRKPTKLQVAPSSLLGKGKRKKKVFIRPVNLVK